MNDVPLLEACVSKSSVLSLLDNYVISNERGLTPASYKMVVSGKCLEIYEYENSIWVNKAKCMREPLPLTDSQIYDILVNPEKYEISEARKKDNEKRRVSRAKTNIRRLCQNNFDKAGKLLTLTFANTDKFDITSLSECHSRLTYFYEQLRAKYPDIKYLTVPEFQKRGAVHYHLVLNLPFVPVEELRALWPYGFIKINKINNPSRVGGYIAKYLAKNVLDERFAHHRCYSTSLNLDKPKVCHAVSLEDFFVILEQMGIKPNYQTEFIVDFRGHMKYFSYNLYETPAREKVRYGSPT